MKVKKQLSPEDILAFEPENKVGLLATINEQGLPHLTLITTLQANGPEEIVFGQFTEGSSKEHVQHNHKTGFLVMNLEKNLWRGKATWRELKKEGKEYVRFNKLPMWRYNSYFGLHTIHYMDLMEVTEKTPLPMAGIVLSSLLTKFAKAGAKTGTNGMVLNQWTKDFFNKLDTLKFMAYIDEDCYPVIIPLIQCQAADSNRLVFNPGGFTEELLAVKPDTDVVILALSLDMKDVVVRGKFAGFKRYQAVKLGSIDINWVYNSMPPLPGQIYPPVDLQTVDEY